MAIVPLLLIKMKVMMAIRMRGMVVPPIVKAKTSLGLGQGTVVDIRTVMYDSRKQLKMKVSLRRKIHIMAFPQEPFLNARWSEDQSAAMPCQPEGRQAAQQVQPVQPGEQIKEGVGWVDRQEVAGGVELLPRKELPDQECEGEQASHNQAVSDAFHPSPACRNLRVLQRDTAQDQHA